MQRFRRPFHVNAVGVLPLEPELGQHRLDIPPDRHFHLPRAIVGAIEIEIGDRVAQRLVPPSEQREHDRRRQKPQPGGDADKRERHIEFGLVRPPLDEREIVHDEQRALGLFRGKRKESERDRRLFVVKDFERVDFWQRRLRAMGGARHILRRVKHAPVEDCRRPAPGAARPPQAVRKTASDRPCGLRRKARHDALVDGPEHQAGAQFDVALRPFVDNDRRHLGHRGDEHRDGRQPEKGVTDRRNAQQRRYAGVARSAHQRAAARPDRRKGPLTIAEFPRAAESRFAGASLCDRARAPLQPPPRIADGRSIASPPQREGPRCNQASPRISAPYDPPGASRSR